MPFKKHAARVSRVFLVVYFCSNFLHRNEIHSSHFAANRVLNTASGEKKLNPTPNTLHPTPYTLHPTPCTPRPTPYTLHPTFYPLHPAPYTLHPTPYTLHLFFSRQESTPERISHWKGTCKVTWKGNPNSHFAIGAIGALMNRVLQPRPLVVRGLNVWMGTAAGADELVDVPYREF